MIYIILAVAASAAVTLVMKAAGNGKGNRYGILLGNYLTCVFLALIQRRPAGLRPDSVTVLCGIIGGILFVAGLVMMQKSIPANGASLTAAFSKLGLLVPLLLSVAVFHERLTLTRTAGILLAMAAILVIHSAPSEPSSGKISTPLLAGVLLGCGSGDAMAKVFEEIGEPAQESLYFLILFAAASLITYGLSVPETKRTGLRIRKEDLLAGVAVGIPNYYSAAMLLKALDRLPAILAYPVCSAGSLVLIILLSGLLFRERLRSRTLKGILMILAALVLLNL